MKLYLFDFQNLWKRSFYVGINQSQDIYGTFPVYVGIKSFLSSLPQYSKGDLILYVNDLGKRRSKVLEQYKKNRKTKSGQSWYLHNLESKLRIDIGEVDLKKIYIDLQTLFKEFLSLFGIFIDFYEVEADDIIAILTEKYYDANQIYIISTDKDFLQLLYYDNVRIIRKHKNLTKIYKPSIRSSTLANIFNLPEPHSYLTPITLPILRAFLGDPSDNIPGIKGIGPKAVLNILNLIEKKYKLKDFEKFIFDYNSVELSNLIFDLLKEDRKFKKYYTEDNIILYSEILKQIILFPNFVKERISITTFEAIHTKLNNLIQINKEKNIFFNLNKYRQINEVLKKLKISDPYIAKELKKYL